MNETLLVGADPELKRWAKSNNKKLSEYLDLIQKKLYNEYVTLEEEKSKAPSEVQNWSQGQIHIAGQQAAILKTLKLLRFDLKKLIPENE